MPILPLLFTLDKARRLREQSQKKALMATCSGIGAVCSVLVGSVLQTLLPQQPNAFHWGTILASFVLLPLSWLVAFRIWDFLRERWQETDNFIYKLKFLEEEFLRNIHIIDNSGMSQRDMENAKRNLYREFEQDKKRIGLKVRDGETGNILELDP